VEKEKTGEKQSGYSEEFFNLKINLEKK